MADPDPPRTVLVVEDEPNIRELVALHLQLDGWTVTQTGDGQDALRLARAEAFDLVILDLMLPGLDGMTVLRAIRREASATDVPVLLLTARRDESDKVLGLESGADDYLTKPFGVRELVARARALTRRPRAGAGVGVGATAAGIDAKPVRLGPLVVDPARRSVTIGEREVELTGREFDLLHLLASHPGIVFSREALVQRVWRGDTFVTARNIDTLVKRLRQKVESNPAEPALILTVWGAGYKAADVETPANGQVVWYRSFYWRIAIGFVLTVAVVLVLQAALFLWLASTTDAIGMRPGRLVAVAAAELSTALEADAALDVDAWLKREFGRNPHRVFVVRGDRVHRNGSFDVPPFLARMARFRLLAADGLVAAPREPPEGRGLRGRRPPFQPVVVRGRTVAVVGVLPAPGGRDPVLTEFGPTLIAAALALLMAGTAVMAILVFRPVHRRLRGLEQAAAAVGAGQTAVRAPESGGDEVASLARRFNRMAADLDARVQELHEADRSRRQLLADVSHELMTPLTAMRGYLETLALPAAVTDEATRTRYLAIVTEETLRLEAIIGDLLDLARLEGGGGSIAHDRVPVVRLFERVDDRHQGALAERGVTLEREIATGAETVTGDERRLEQVLQNLVANAVRHTTRGGRIALRAVPDRADVVLVVEDTGPGIPAEHLPHVFDRFYRVDSARDAKSGGSGLGLSIVRAVIEQHGGRVSAANGPMGGARFELRLPVIRRAGPGVTPVSDSGTRA